MSKQCNVLFALITMMISDGDETVADDVDFDQISESAGSSALDIVTSPSSIEDTLLISLESDNEISPSIPSLPSLSCSKTESVSLILSGSAINVTDDRLEDAELLEAKDFTRKLRNREHARNSRDRFRMALRELEKENSRLVSARQKLLSDILQLKWSFRKLKKWMKNHVCQLKTLNLITNLSIHDNNEIVMIVPSISANTQNNSQSQSDITPQIQPPKLVDEKIVVNPTTSHQNEEIDAWKEIENWYQNILSPWEVKSESIEYNACDFDHRNPDT